MNMEVKQRRDGGGGWPVETGRSPSCNSLGSDGNSPSLTPSSQIMPQVLNRVIKFIHPLFSDFFHLFFIFYPLSSIQCSQIHSIIYPV